MYKSYSMDIGGKTLTVEIGRVCAQANGAALMRYGDTTVLSTATASDKPRDGIDSDYAVLTSRVIDRQMSPLFPKVYRNDVTLNNMVMSVDPQCRPEITAMLGAAVAACISDIPFCGPCAMTQIGMMDGQFIINPSQQEWDEGDLQRRQ